MKEVVLDATRWSTKDDIYDAFFRAVGAPEWHGRNLDALRDSIAGGSINQLEVPYRLVVRNYNRIAGDAKRMADDFIDLIHELGAEGCSVQIRVMASDGGSKRSRIQQHRLSQLESDFKSALTAVLKDCAGGRWGLFGQNDHTEGAKYLSWSAAEAVKDRAKQIHALGKEFGEPNALADRFLHYCSLRGANVPGEPKLAKALLDEIESRDK
jgi:RNAse (barnase) inhibitor barstar